MRRGGLVLVVLVSLLAVEGRAGAIVGGTTIPVADLAPTARAGWLVRLETDAQRCTGALVHAEWVLTAAHCIDGTAMVAFVGDSTTPVAIDDEAIDPAYDDTDVGIHDVAVVHLATPSAATPVFLGLDAADTPAVTGTVSLMGWGQTTAGGPQATAPAEGTTTVAERTTPRVITDGGAVGCGGDSGGPVLANGEVVGVMSGSDATCSSTTLSSRLSASKAFLEDTVPLPSQDPIVQSGSIETHGVSTFSFTATSHDGTPLGIDDLTDITGAEGGIECSGVTSPITCTYGGRVGLNTLRFTITDDVGSSVATWRITRIGDVFVIPFDFDFGPLTVDEGDGADTILEVLIASDPPAGGHDVEVAIEGIEATVGADLSPGAFSADVDGTEVVTITADDLAEGDEQFTFTPDPVPPFLVGIPTTFTIVDDDDGTIGARRNIVAEAAGLLPGERLRVPYRAPTARDQHGAAAAVRCAPSSGSRFSRGATDATCTSAAHAERAFTVTVQAPTSPGAVTCPAGGAPLACVVAGGRIRVTAGGYRSRAATTIGFVAGDGSVRPLATPTAAANGRVDDTLTVPRSTLRGDRQLVVTGPGTGRDRVRSFDLRVAGSC